MSTGWFGTVRSMVERHTGVSIDAGKQYLAESRLSSLVIKYRVADMDALLSFALQFGNGEVEQAIIDAMMTGETFFFRDAALFEHIKRSILPDIIRRNEQARSIRIWCAACSTGQEPYSVSMILDGLADSLRGWQVEIVASDISTTALERARTGEYNQFEVQRGLPVNLLLRYFQRNNDRWLISEHLRSMITFERSNLLEPSRNKVAVFDLILCRNILMYFGSQTRIAAVEGLARCLAPNGRIILGTSEAGIVSDPVLVNDGSFPSIFKAAEPRAPSVRPRAGTQAA